MIFSLIIGISISFGIIFAKKTHLAIIGAVSSAYSFAILSDFIIPTWESNQFIQTASLFSFHNLMFRSIIIIIYADDRCDFESKILTYFKSEEDKLWIWFKYLIYQMIFFRILGFIALYIQANYEKFNFNKFFSKYKNLKGENIQLNQQKNSSKKLKYENKAFVDDDNDKIERKIQIENHCDNEILRNSIDQRQNYKIEINSESTKTFAISWKNLSYSIETIFSKKLILKNLKGKIDFGTITALMGPSGAGKTTLLKCINGIKQSGLSKDTQFYVNKFTKIKPVFIVQEPKNHLLINLTVRESLKYSSLLKNSQQKINKNNQPNQVNSLDYLVEIVKDQMEFNHNLNINKILSELMLTKCADNFVSQCSGGEQKRLSIGLELTPKIKPNLICIDEPTSGLDSYAAEQVSLLFLF